MKNRKHLNKFLLFFLIGLSPFLLLSLLEIIFLKRIESFDTTIVQAPISGLFSGFFGFIIELFKSNRLIYKTLILILLILFLIVTTYVIWVFYLELKWPYFSEI